MYPDLAARLCLTCNVKRIPDVKTVKQGRLKYVIYTCRICKLADIERWADRPRPKVWDGSAFIEELPDIDTDEDRD